jgi:integrase
MHIADFLRKFEVEDKKRSAQAYRSLLKDVFETGCKAGWIDSNPVSNTSVDNVKVKRSRLTLGDLLAVYEEAKRDAPTWVARAIELAIVAAQRREDVRDAMFSMHHDGKLWVEQEKTGARVRIPDSLRLEAFSLSVSDVIKRCRDGVVSRYMIHHTKHAGRAKPGDKVRAATISQEFARCVRPAKARAIADGNNNLFAWKPGSTPPSFHEIRSLSARLYSIQGVDTQSLLGHKSPSMTAVYKDSRGADWVDVRIA